MASERFSAAAPSSIARKSNPRSAVGGERGRFSTIYRRASYTRRRLGRREEDEGAKARSRGRGKSDAGETQKNGGDGRHVRGLWGSKHETSMLFVQNGEVQYSGEECQASHWEGHKRLCRANGTRTPRATMTNGVTGRTTRTTARCWSDAEKWAWLSIIASEEGKEQEMPLLVLLG